VVGQRPAPDPVLLVAAGNLLVQEFLAGVAEREAVVSPPRGPAATPAELVRCLVEHGTAPTDTHLALAYLVVVVDLPDPCEEALADITGTLAPYGPGVLVAPEPFGAVVLVPDASDDGERRIAERLTAVLGGRTWGALAGRARPELPSAYEEAVQVLALARAARRDPGIYRRADFLLEFAAVRDDAVAADLVTIIEPLMSSAVLYETLEALIDADFNRSRAAKILFVHRSTLDYRLHRIEEITGRSPATVQGAQVLSVARTVYLTRASTAR
jgi:hypothetical protein